MHSSIIFALAIAAWSFGALAATPSTTRPAPEPTGGPGDVIYRADRTYHVAPTGSDRVNDGSIARPFASFVRAQQQAIVDRRAKAAPKVVEIDFLAAGSQYKQTSSVATPDIVIGAYGQKGPDDRPIIISDDVAFLSIPGRGAVHGIHYQNLTIRASPKGGKYGIYSNGCDDITLDYCEVEGFGLDVSLSGGKDCRLWHNWIGKSWVSGMGRSQGLYTELIAPDSQANVFYHCGWNDHDFDITNAQHISLLKFNHGHYESQSHGSTAGIDRCNIYIDNATSGHQARNGGTIEWDVFQSNGAASDAFVDGAQGEISHCVVFGPTHAGPFWGGGLLGIAQHVKIHDCLFACASTIPLPAAVTIAWPVHDHGPPPPGMTAEVYDIRGIWPHEGLKADDGRTVKNQNIAIRPARPNEHVPTLLDYLGAKDDDDAAEKLRKLHEPKYSAIAIIKWAQDAIK